jgi:predicted transcriptional regulator
LLEGLLLYWLLVSSVNSVISSLGKYYTMSRTMEQVLSHINSSVLDNLYCDFITGQQDSQFFNVETLAIELSSKD